MKQLTFYETRIYICSMNTTQNEIIDVICKVLALEKEKLMSKQRQSEKYQDARLIGTYLMRNNISEKREIKWGNRNGKSWSKTGMHRYSILKKITYLKIAHIFKRKSPQTIMAAVLKCDDLLKTDSEFKEKYNIVVNLLANK